MLHLIEKNKVDIYDIPIALITDQYLDYLKKMEIEDLNVMSEFLVMAATLLDIKAKMLLPAEVNEDGEEELQDELDMLANAYADESGKPAELTDDFIKEISGGQFKDLAAYTAALEEQMKSEYDEFYELQYYEDLWNAAVDNATVIKDFPPEYLQKKTERSVINARKYAQSLNMPFEDFVDQKMGMTVEEFNTQAIEYAKVAAKESMVLAAIAKAENITVTDEDIEKAIKEYVDLGAFDSEEAFRNEGPERMEELREYILMSKVQDFLAENSK